MNKHTVDIMTTAALRDLDPAPTTVLTDEELERADATFARILATPSHDQVPQESDRPRRRRSRLLVLLGLVGAAGAAVPAMLLSGGSAFASWTPKPEPLTAAAVSRGRYHVPRRPRGSRPGRAGRDRRATWRMDLRAPRRPQVGRGLPDARRPRRASVPRGPQEGRIHRGLHHGPRRGPDPARDRIVETENMAGSVPTPGPWFFSDDEGWVSWVEGYVGSDVTGVTVHTPIGIDVEASVANGRFAAWWPSDQPSSENPEVMGAWTYTVTLADGSTRRVTG